MCRSLYNVSYKLKLFIYTVYPINVSLKYGVAALIENPELR